MMRFFCYIEINREQKEASLKRVKLGWNIVRKTDVIIEKKKKKKKNPVFTLLGHTQITLREWRKWKTVHRPQSMVNSILVPLVSLPHNKYTADDVNKTMRAEKIVKYYEKKKTNAGKCETVRALFVYIHRSRSHSQSMSNGHIFVYLCSFFFTANDVYDGWWHIYCMLTVCLPSYVLTCAHNS